MITVVQSRISSESAVPMDSAGILGLLENLAIKSSFIDWNITPGTALPVSELIYLSLYTVVPFRPESDIPLALKTLHELKKQGAGDIIVGVPHAAAINTELFIKAGAKKVFHGDTVGLLQKHLNDLSGKTVFPSFEKIPVRHYRKSIFSDGKNSFPLIVSRGCGFNCSYCTLKFDLETKSRNEIKLLIERMITRYGANHFMVEDDLFNSSREKVKIFCEVMTDYFPGVTWECLNGLHPANLSTGLLLQMQKAGCIHVAIGIECLDQNFLKGRDRKYDVLETLNMISEVSSKGLIVSGYLLWDFLRESPIGILRQLRLIRQSDIILPHISFLVAPGKTEKIFRIISLIFLYSSFRRIRFLFKAGAFSGKYIKRSLHKVIRA